jgi:chaperonin GroES
VASEVNAFWPLRAYRHQPCQPDLPYLPLSSAQEVTMQVRPLRDRLLVKRIEETEPRVGGIIIPDTAKEKPQTAKVIAVGKGRVNDKGDVFPLDVKAGEYILIGKYAGTEIKYEGEDYLILREDEVLGIAEGVRESELAAV